MLSPTEINHYQRHLSLPGFGMECQLRLKKSSVLVIGAGGLGCPVLQYLSAVGVGKIGIVDDDVVDKSNLQRQILFNYNDVGLEKVKVAKSKLEVLNPNIEIIEYCDRFTSHNAQRLLNDFDIVVDGTDNFSSRYLINDACVLYDKVLIYGSIFQFEGQVSVFNYQNGPTYRCLYPTPPSSDILPNCSEVGVLGVLPGIIGNFQALEAIKVITGIGDNLSGKVLLYNALNQKSRIIKLNRSEQLPDNISLSEISQTCSKNTDNMNDSNVNELTPNEASSVIKENEKIILLDVREDWERENSKIVPSLHIPLGEFSFDLQSKLPSEFSVDDHIIVYCKAGVRSRVACDTLASLGFKNLYNLTGGIVQWESDGLPLG
jgi:adenylyltransferase/sulfurtransferase